RPELQWSVVSGQRRRFTYFRVESGLDMAPLLPEVQESSPQYWDAPTKSGVSTEHTTMLAGALFFPHFTAYSLHASVL
ncbi:MAG: hypothetical protein OXF86_14310, partial [Caldilineaceae bacterium]|nr:hypothetical protein [Caldilineaceae bacterium]